MYMPLTYDNRYFLFIDLWKNMYCGQGNINALIVISRRLLEISDAVEKHWGGNQHQHMGRKKRSYNLKYLTN